MRICTSPAPGGGGAATSSELDLAVADKRERAHGARRGGVPPACPKSSADGAGHAGSRVRTSEMFWPPKPNELEIARSMRASRASFGTTSSGIAGSGTR